MTKKIKSKKYLKIILILLFFLTIAISSYLFSQVQTNKIQVSYKNKLWFDSQPNLIYPKIHRLFDLGVVDINSDQYLDIYSSNHSSKQLLLVNNQKNNFSQNKISEFSLDQSSDFPGLEENNVAPKILNPGLYIYWKNRYLVIENHLSENTDSVNGTIQILSTTKLKVRNNGFVINKFKRYNEKKLTKNIIEFSSKKDNSQLKFKASNSALINIDLNAKISTDKIFVGSNLVNPKSTKIAFSLRDRHGMAWADYNGDNLVDLFISRGGLSGKMADYPYTFYDELLINNKNTKFKDIIRKSEIIKGSCPARQTSWVDVNNDNLLDIYVVCSDKTSQSNQNNSNLLYKQEIDQTFTNIAAEKNLDFRESGSFVWLDVDKDTKADLFWVNNDGFWLYKNKKEKFNHQIIGNVIPADKSKKSIFSKFKLTVSDYDNDGDLDIFFISPQGSALLAYDNNNYKIINSKSIGLPSAGFTANWVDFDNDGLVDIHILPSGLYRQTSDHNFEATHLLENNSDRLNDARATWFDQNNDGSRDLLLATHYSSIFPSWLVKIFIKLGILETVDTPWNIAVYSNLDTSNHWLELELVGTSRNPQAINTQVEITMGDRTTIQTIGQSEGSHYSQGHYRLYYGLGKKDKIDLIKIYWSDGFVQEISDIKGDQLLTIKR